MEKISTVTIERIQIFKQNQLTIGLDLGDRSSHYCILNEAGEVIFEHELPTRPKGIEEVFSRIPRSRIALETGTHSPWVSRQLTQWGHEVIVAHARNVRLIGESSRKDDPLDARTPEAARLDGKKIHISNNKTVLTHTGLLMEGTSRRNSADLAGASSRGKRVVSRQGEAYDA